MILTGIMATKDVEKGEELPPQQTNRIRVTLNSPDVKSLEKGIDYYYYYY